MPDGEPLIPPVVDPPKAPAPTTATVIETQSKVTTSGDAVQTAQAAQVAMSARFDDWVRFILAQQVVGGFLFIVIYGQVTGHQPDQNTLMVYVSFVSLSLGFYLGSSYGSAAARKQTEKV